MSDVPTDHSGAIVSVSDIENAPINLGIGQGPVDLDKYEQLISKFTEVSNDNFNLKTENETLKKRVRTSEILDALIQPYARLAFQFMCIYCTVVAAFIFLSGWKETGFTQPEKVLEIMVGSTAVTVIGLVGMVLTGIFVGARKGSSP